MTNLLIAPGIPLKAGATAWLRMEGQGQPTIPDPVPGPGVGNRFIDLTSVGARWNGTDLQGYIGSPSAWGGASTGLLDRAGTRHLIASTALATPRVLGELGALDLSEDAASAYVDGLDLRGNVEWALACIVSRVNARYEDTQSVATAFEPLTYGTVPLVRALDPGGPMYLLPTGANLQIATGLPRSMTIGLVLHNLPGSGLRCWVVDSKVGGYPAASAWAANPIGTTGRLHVLSSSAQNSGAQGYLHEMVYLQRAITQADLDTMMNGVRFHAILGKRPEYGLILTGQEAAVGFSHQLWVACHGVASLMGGLKETRLRWPDPGAPGFYYDDAMGALREDYFPTHYTVREGTALYSDSSGAAWLQYEAGVAPEFWQATTHGQQVLGFITEVMDAEDRALVPALLYFGGETDTVSVSDAVTYGRALVRWVSLLRAAFGRTAASLPCFILPPIPFQGGTTAGYDNVAAAHASLLVDPDHHFRLGLGNTADAEARSGDNTRISDATRTRWAVRASYAIQRGLVEANLRDSYTTTGIPGVGPRIVSAAAVNATTTDLTISHEVPNADLQVLGAAATGAGFTMTHNGGVDLAVTACAKQSNTVLRLTHASATGTRTVSYCRRGLRVAVGDMVVDAWSGRGWPTGMDLDAAGLLPGPTWKPDIPLRATLGAIGVS